MIPRWEKFKHFFQITIFRYLVVWFSLVPVLAKVLESLPQTLKFNSNSEINLILNLSLPFNWQLLWLSSLFFLFAWIIYLVRCPAFIKQYNQYSEYSSYGHDPRWLVSVTRDLLKFEFFEKNKKEILTKLVNRLEIKKYIMYLEDQTLPEKAVLGTPFVDEIQTKLFFKLDAKLYCFAMPIIVKNQQNADTEKGIFWEVFECFSGSRKYSRILICILLGISALFFLYVFGQHIIEGMRYVYTWLHPIQVSHS